MFRSKLSYLLVFLLFITTIPFHAQDSEINIAVAMPEFYQVALAPVLADFDKANPDIRIEIVDTSIPFYVTGDGLDAYLDKVENLASSADIVIGTGIFDPLTTRAGYFLNLDPLITADPNFNADDFYPAMLGSYQWDLGTWALPISSDIQILHYNPTAFDEVGLDYPNEDWTTADLRVAAETLAVIGSDGQIQMKPIRATISIPYLSLLTMEEPLYDPTQIELVPIFDKDTVFSSFEAWALLGDDGYMSSEQTFDQPIIIGTSSFASILAGLGYQMVSLPAGSTTLVPLAAGMSAGTSYPEEAYRVLRFMSEDPAIFHAIGQPIPAQRALSTEQVITSSGSLSDEAHQTILDYAETAQPYTNLLFFSYVFGAYRDSQSNGTELQLAFRDAQTQAIDDLQAAMIRQDRQIVVNTGGASAIDGIEIRFGLFSGGSSSLNVYAEEFAATHPSVGSVDFVRLIEFTALDTFASTVDCFYKPTLLSNTDDLSILLALDPLMAVDTELDSSDFAGSALERVSQNGLIYGFPLHIQPQVMVYNMDLLEAQGIDFPKLDWTTSEFEDFLRTFHQDANDPAALDIRTYGGIAILNLIATYGGLPIDPRTTPEAVDFTSEESVSAIRYVLDLARDGYIQYDPLFENPNENLYQDLDDAALYAQFITYSSNSMIDNVDTSEGNYGLAPFPRGHEFSPIDYDLGAGYISAESQYFNECYDFIKYLSEQTDAFEGVPARVSIVESDSLQQQEREENIAFYRAVHEILQDDNLIEFQFAGSLDIVDASKVWIRTWLFRAMDRYVFEDADLEEELRLAEETTLLYQECIATLPLYDPKTQSVRDFLMPFLECVVVVDPDMMEVYGHLLQ